MATIPDSRALGRRIPQSRRQIVSDQSGQIIAGAIQNVGEALGRFEEKRDRFNYAKARSALLQADIEARRELEEDLDWQTIETRYRERMTKAREQSAGLISGRTAKALFDQDARLDLERGAAAIGELSRRREGDAGRADLETALSANRAAALNAADIPTREEIIISTKKMIMAARDSGYIDGEAAAATQRKWTESYAEGYVALLDPQRRIEVLSNPAGTPANFLQPDQRKALLKVAQNEDKEVRVRQEAQAAEDAIFAAGGSLESMRAKARKIEDPMVRDSTVARLEARFGDREEDRDRYDKQLRRRAWDVVLKGGKWDDIPTSVASTMDPEDGIRIKSYLAQKGNGADVKTDPVVWYNIRRAQGDSPVDFAELDLLIYRDKLSEADFETFANAQEAIREDVRKGDSARTDNQLVNDALDQLGIRTTGRGSVPGRKRAAEFSLAFDRELSLVRRETGKSATPEQKQAIIDRLSMEVVTKRGWVSDSKALLFEADEVLEVVVPKAERKKIVAALEKRGIAVTEERIQELYLRGKQ